MRIWDSYLKSTPQRVKLIDVFMAFLVVVGGLQFVYCVLAGNYVSCFAWLCCGGDVEVGREEGEDRWKLGAWGIMGKE